MKFRPGVTIAFLVATTIAAACLNDRDTLGEEARAKPDVLWIIVGRFERNPPLYYQMRIDRITRALAKTPGNLALYDDISVALDRLHRDSEAIGWIEKKRRRLAAIPNNARLVEDWYRTFANEGTFYAHRWFGSKDRSNLSGLQTARDLIAHGLKLKPNAHFGRETYQLAALDFFLDEAKTGSGGSLFDYIYEHVRGQDGRDQNREQIAEGIAGLIRLGGAWESPDAYEAMGEAWQAMAGSQHLKTVAWLRRDELIAAGKPMTSFMAQLRSTPKPEDVADFERLRKDANTWQDERTRFMMPRLLEGRHPDTDPTFWDGYAERPLPTLYIRSWWDKLRWMDPDQLAFVIGAPVLMLIAVGFYVAGRRKERAKRPSLAR